MKGRNLVFVFLIFIFFLLPFFVSANSTGTIDASSKTARFEDSTYGTINLKPTNGGITVTDSTLTGYAWGSIVGWINFDPAGGGVNNNNEGSLSGYAWGEKTGWINFNPTNGGVTINSEGVFSGYAWSQNYGWIIFNCSTDSSCDTFNHSVKTDWRPRSTRPACNNSTDDDGDGLIDYPNDLGCSSLTDTSEVNPGGGGPIVIAPVIIPEPIPEPEPPIVDVCPNIGGVQTTIPTGMIFDGFGNCSMPEEESDVCPNIAGAQSAVPSGMVVDGFGNCIIPEDETDLCPNISGKQASIPSGMVLSPFGECVTGPLPPEIEPPIIPPVIEANPVANAIVTSISSAGGAIFEGTANAIVSVLPTQYQEKAAEVVNAVANVGRAVGENVKKVYESPTGQVVTQTVTTVGVAGGSFAAASSVFLNPTSFTEFALIPFRLWTLLLSFLGLKKRYKPWGTVYDSITKQPLDPAYVVLYDTNGKEVSSSITDLDGRYGFLVKPGTYSIVASKTNYVFPSKRMFGRTFDELHSNLYFGEQFTVDITGAVIAKSIPMDPIKFDWNEFAKRSKKLMRFYSSMDVWLARFTGIMFSLGLFVAIVSIFAAPKTYNLVILLLYVAILVLRAIGLKPKTHGQITNTKTGDPLSFAIVRIYSADLNMEISHKVTDALGRYYCLVPNGQYFIKVEAKNPDETYTPIYTSTVFEVKNGIIDRPFKL